jgi:hypothetical protein
LFVIESDCSRLTGRQLDLIGLAGAGQAIGLNCARRLLPACSFSPLGCCYSRLRTGKKRKFGQRTDEDWGVGTGKEE